MTLTPLCIENRAHVFAALEVQFVAARSAGALLKSLEHNGARFGTFAVADFSAERRKAHIRGRAERHNLA